MSEVRAKLPTLDILNIGLMVLAAGAAYLFPFEVFLMAYAILGPLHYITEIGWLHKKNYFVASSKPTLLPYLFLGICILLTFLALRGYFYAQDPQIDSKVAPWFLDILRKVSYFSPGLIGGALVYSIAMTFPEGSAKRQNWQLAALGTVLLLPALPYPARMVGLFLPTLIHVSLFTGAFMLQGALMSKSKWGYLSFGVFVLCNIIFFALPYVPGVNDLAAYTEKSISASGMLTVNRVFASFISGADTPELPFSELGRRVQGFIAFAYTYHYLNWFSKVEVIKWHQVPKNFIVGAVVIWVAALTLYAVNYHLGIVALFTLSMWHVLVEFPLNIRSFSYLKSAVVGR